jgi:hypothetical protein
MTNSIKAIRKAGGRALIGLVAGCKSKQFPRVVDIARPFLAVV